MPHCKRFSRRVQHYFAWILFSFSSLQSVQFKSCHSPQFPNWHFGELPTPLCTTLCFSLSSPISSRVAAMRCQGLWPTWGHPKPILFLYGESLSTDKAAFTSSRMSGEEGFSHSLSSLYYAINCNTPAFVDGTKWAHSSVRVRDLPKAWPEAGEEHSWHLQSEPICSQLCQGCRSSLSLLTFGRTFAQEWK